MPESVKVVFIGQRDWCDLCAASVNGLHDQRAEAVGFEIDRPAQLLVPARLLAAFRADVLVRVGFRPGSPTRSGRAFEAFWSVVRMFNRRAEVVFYWVGTDVALAVGQVTSGASSQRMYALANAATHWATSEQLVQELAAIGIRAEHLTIPWTLKSPPATVPPLPKQFTVLTYIPDTRADFYGGRSILEVARSLPDGQFVVMGGHGRWAEDPPPNVHFVGWVDADEYYPESSVVARVVEHDGGGGTALEGLLYGRHVVYTQERPYCRLVEFGNVDELLGALRELKALHDSGTLRLNHEGRQWALDNVSPHAIASALLCAILKLEAS